MKRMTSVSLVAGLVLAVPPAVAFAQTDTYPNKPVRIIVGFTPGSATDVTARLIALKFSEAWGVAVTVDNVPGAGGTVGAARAAKAPPDGYTLQYGANGAMTIAPACTATAYDPTRDFAPSRSSLAMPSIMAVNNEVPAKSFQELDCTRPGAAGEALLRPPVPERLSISASSCSRSSRAWTSPTVPYKGAIFTDVIGGRVAMTLQNAAAILPTVRDGRLRGLAVSSLKRSPNIPEFPTIAESGFPGFEAVSWFGLLAPAGTPAAIVNKLHQETVKVLGQSDMRARFSQSAWIRWAIRQRAAAIIRSDVGKWTKVIKEAGITAATRTVTRGGLSSPSFHPVGLLAPAPIQD